MLSTLDMSIIVIYMIGMIALGYFMGKDNKDQDDYFLAGRSMPWIPVALSIAATMISCNGFVGGPGWGYQSGLLPFVQNIGVPLSLMISIAVFTPMLYNLRVTSVYEYVEFRLGAKTRMVAVIGFIMNSLFQASSMVFVPALVFNRFTGISINVIIPILVIIAIIYTLLGGIKAVIWTDAVQMIVIWGGLLLGIGYIFTTSDIGFFETISMAHEAGKLKALDFTLETSIADPNGFWVASIAGTVMWLRYFSFDQAQVQRMYTSKSLRGLKRSFVFSGIMMNLLFFLFIFLGVLLFVQFGGQTFENTNDVMIEFISRLPAGLVGILIAGLLAAAMSSIDSLLNSMSTVFVKDIYEKYMNKNQEASLKTSMLISAIWGVLLIGITIVAFSETTKSILDAVGGYISYISGPTCGLFILAMFTKKANDKGTAIGVVLGFIFIIIFGKTAGLNWMWNPGVGMVATVAFGYIASCIFKEKLPENAMEYTLNGYKEKLIREGNTEEDGVSLLPFKMDKYSYILLGVFLFQIVILLAIGM